MRAHAVGRRGPCAARCGKDGTNPVQLSAPLKDDPIEAVPWRGMHAPARLLVIRLQAFGDVVLTLPYVHALKRLWPGVYVDFLTRDEYADLPRDLALFDRVFALHGGRRAKLQVAFGLTLVPRLMTRRYDIVADLQRNRVSRTIRRLLRPAAWTEFDRFSPRLAGERTRLTIEALGITLPPVYADLQPKREDAGREALERAGWDPRAELVVLNPAGAFPTRNWPLENYVAFAQLWAARRDRPTQFGVVGLSSLRPRVDYLKARLGPRVLDLVGRTTTREAFGILRRATLVLSEDSGLMHLGWVAGTPTLALFGSSRHVWSAPHGNYSLCLHSGDLPCGACMDTECRFGDVHCLTRYTPEVVAQAALGLVRRADTTPRVIWQRPDANA